MRKSVRIPGLAVMWMLFFLPHLLQAQSRQMNPDYGFSLSDHSFSSTDPVAYPIDPAEFHVGVFQDEETRRREFPDPEKVLYRSLILPGWGQVTNRQIWKVPVIYAVFAGVIYYNWHLTTQYHGFRAAYYNESMGGESDFRFGQTPDFVPSTWTADQLKSTRDNLRNQRDFSYVMIFLAYGLNAIDAYVFAHMRSFDVSDDLSASARIGPGVLEPGVPGIHLQVRLAGRSGR